MTNKNTAKRNENRCLNLFSVIWVGLLLGGAILGGCAGGPLSAQETDEDLRLFQFLYEKMQSHYVDELDANDLIYAGIEGLYEEDDTILDTLVSEEEFVQLEEEEAWNTFVQWYYVALEEQTIEENDSEEPKPLMYSAIESMFSVANDQHTRFMDEWELEQLSVSTAGAFGGVGMYVNKYRSEIEEEQFLEVISPIEGTPAFYAGLQAGDLIVDIEGKSTQLLSTTEAVLLLRGVPGTSVTIGVKRGSSEIYKVTLKRETIQIPSVRFGVINDDIAYIELILFSENTVELFEEAYKEMDAEYDLSGLIVDMRGNGGGLLSSAIQLGDFFFRNGTIVSIEGRIKSRNQEFKARRATLIPTDLPVAVLVDGGSASASEILVGALKDRTRAITIGEKTYGKGSVQEIFRFGEVGARLTVARYYTPAGETIDGVGIEPDIEISNPSLDEEKSAEFLELIQSGKIVDFAQANKSASDDQIEKFVNSLTEGDETYRWHVGRYLRQEMFRFNENKPLAFDLDYDDVLQRAVEEVSK